jgi:hypothetical protein
MEVVIMYDIWQGKARQGKARQGKARQGKARQGKARQGKARQGARHLLGSGMNVRRSTTNLGCIMRNTDQGIETDIEHASYAVIAYAVMPCVPWIAHRMPYQESSLLKRTTEPLCT